MRNIKTRTIEAVKFFWDTRESQGKNAIGDQGSRTKVTGGKQMEGFEHLATEVIKEAGMPADSIFSRSSLELPGYYRPEKKWDLLVIHNNKLITALEFKSQVGSFGNNFNNRSEEAIGTASDIWVAYREKAFGLEIEPWLGYLFLLEEHPKSIAPVKLKEPHFKAFQEFEGSSYAKRYEILLSKLRLERLYQGTSLILSNPQEPERIIEVSHSLSVEKYFQSLHSHISSYINILWGSPNEG